MTNPTVSEILTPSLDMSKHNMLVSEAYPFPEAPDIETSSPAYDTRFSGPIGKWFVDVQTKALLKILGSDEKKSILDVGGGHAQTAVPLIERRYNVSVLGSTLECSRKLASFIEEGRCNFIVGKVLELPFPNRFFNTVISFRLMSHIENWPLLIAELCRVADDSVVIDYPPKGSFNALLPILFKTKKRLEGNTRNYLVFSRSDVCKEFEKHGFIATDFVPQYFLPMVLHRVIKNPAISSAIEKISSLLGLCSLFGSPVVAGFKRVEGSPSDKVVPLH